MARVFSFFLLLVVVLEEIWGATIVDGPVSVTRDPNQWAEFSCTVACSHTINWFVEGYLGDITGTCSSTRNGMMACTEVVQACSSATSTQGYTERLRLLAKPDLASSSVAVQCAAVSRSTSVSPNDCPPFLSYSRYALLTVRPPATDPPTAPPPATTPPPTTPPFPSPSPVVCPSVTQSGLASAQTETVTATVTATVTQTVAVTVTVTPEADPAFSRGVKPGGHLGKVVSELVSWAVTLLAGLLVI